jgi:hypothetical protein
MMQLASQREDLRLQGITGPKTGRDQSEKGDERELIVVATIISRMIGTRVFSDRTEFSVTTTISEMRGVCLTSARRPSGPVSDCDKACGAAGDL